MQVKKKQLEMDMEQQTGSKSGKEYVKAVYRHPAYLTYMRITSCKMLSWMKQKLKHKLESKLLEETQAGIKIARGNISNLRYADDTTLMAESAS